jgi:hypothetical protein
LAVVPDPTSALRGPEQFLARSRPSSRPRPSPPGERKAWRCPVSGLDPRRWSDKRSADRQLLQLVATVIDACGRQPGRGSGHPPTETVRVVAALRRFLRE